MISKFEMHYFFPDNSHHMDAFVRHRCETELLYIIKEIASKLDVEIEIDSEALGEGGLKNWWKILGKNAGQLALIISVATVILDRFPPSNKEIETLQQEDLKLSIEERKLNIEKLKKEVQKIDDKAPSKDTVNKVVSYFELSYKIIKHRHNFYRALNEYPKVKRITATGLNDNNKSEGDSIKVERKDFAKYFMKSDTIPTSPKNDAVIDIVSPVLKTGNYKWRGLFDNKPIDFFMNDEKYKKDVIDSKFSFHNGSAIICVLKYSRKINDVGEIENVNFAVETVLETTDEGSQFIETKQGKKYKLEQEQLKKQGKLFN